MDSISSKGILTLIGALTILIVSIKPYFRFIFRKNPLSRAFLLITIIFLVACIGAIQKGVFGQWVQQWIKSLIY